MAARVMEVFIGRRAFSNVEAAFKHIDDSLLHALDAAARPVGKALRAALQLVVKEMERMHSTPWRPTPGGRNLYRRSGGGLRSIARSVRINAAGRLEAVEGQIGAGFPISVHEEGATVTAKRARFLTIPLPAAMNNRGIPLRRRARDWDNTFVARSRRGNLIIFQRRGTGIVPLYLLKRSVKIPARLRLGETLERTGLPYFEAQAIKMIEAAFDKAA